MALFDLKTPILDREPNSPLAALGTMLLLGVLVATVYGAFQPAGTPSALLMLMTTIAAIMSGSILGFLFGIPRFDYGIATAAAVNDAQAGTNTSAGAQAKAVAKAPRYKPSASLDEIADWLTKIIIGLGLIQLKEIGPRLKRIAAYVTSGCHGACPEERFVAATIVFGIIGGFLFAYVWTRLYYAKLAAKADVDTDRTLRQMEVVSAETYGVGGKPAAENSSADSSETPTAMGSASVAGTADLDPNKGKFGRNPMANRRALRATVDPSESQAGLYRVTLQVRSTTVDKPLGGTVTFVLHPTFRKRRITVPVVNGVAELILIAWGAFTVGALCDSGETQLELDLAELADAPEEFRSK